jgi:hypothetical protein
LLPLSAAIMVRRQTNRRTILSFVTAIVMTAIACHPTDDTTYVVQRLALDTLFNGREHARQLVIWSSDSPGPALELILSQQALEHARIDIQRLEPTLPATAIDEQMLADLFREHPDGWAEFFRRYSQSSGLVELSPVRLSSGNRLAELFVGRSCGEHCRNAWRIVAKRTASGAWRVAELQWIGVPLT